MINLLPPETKKHYLYARRNTVLRRWTVAFVIGLLGVGLLGSLGMFYTQRSINSYTSQVAAQQTTLKKQKLDAVQKQVQDLTGSLKLATQVLSREILFSKLLKQIATVIPANANLTDLSINQVKGGIDISANTNNYNTATQLQINLQDPNNQIFAKADILSITCNGQSQDKRYPCLVQIRALFGPNNPYLFISNSSAGNGVKP